MNSEKVGTTWTCVCGAVNDPMRTHCYRGCRPKLREPVNVADALARDRLVRRTKRIREEAVLDKNTIDRWNRMHPDEQPIDSGWCDEIIAWCDGKGPFPSPRPETTEP